MFDFIDGAREDTHYFVIGKYCGEIWPVDQQHARQWHTNGEGFAYYWDFGKDTSPDTSIGLAHGYAHTIEECAIELEKAYKHRKKLEREFYNW